MQKAPINKRLADTTFHAPYGLYKPVHKACTHCGRDFELLSAEWVYRVTHKGRQHYFCSYKCWRADDRKRNPIPRLKGEKRANNPT